MGGLYSYDYDTWRLENGYMDYFKCPKCELIKDLDELGESEEMCLACEENLNEQKV